MSRELEQSRSATLFGTPLFTHVWANAAELNPRLKHAILEHAGRSSGEERTNVGGWHSEAGGLEFCGDAGRRVIQHMQDLTEWATHRLYDEFAKYPSPMRWTFNAWANVSAPGDFNKMHMHPGATWSGVYYVDPGETHPSADGTPLHLSDPNPVRTSSFFPELFASNVLIKPEPGLMVLFPSYVPHAVLPHRGDRPRISIAFNMRREPFP